MIKRCSLALAWILASPWVGAQTSLENPDWVEDQAPPPPAFRSTHLVAIDMPPYVTLKVGIDPDTLTVGKDGIVRYVVVMTNASGSVTAAYEAIRCEAAEVKTYARYSASGVWNSVENPPWRAWNDNMPSRHAQAFARQGACDIGMARSKAEILEQMPKARR